MHPELGNTTPFPYYTASRGEYWLNTDPSLLDLDAIHAYITRFYWASGRSREAVARTLQHALCFGVYHRDTQVGFARLITDFTAIAHLCDVYILEEHRSQGLGKWLVASVLVHPQLQPVRRWMLATSDAHDFYAQFGFTALSSPERQMELVRVTPPGLVKQTEQPIR